MTMEKLLLDINGVTGVIGSYVCGPEGEVLASTLPAVFDSGMLSTVGRTFARTMEALRVARRRKINEMDIVYDGGRLVVKNVSTGCLVILCVPNMNVPLLNLTANVVARKVQEHLKGREGGGEKKAPPAEIVQPMPATPVEAVVAPAAPPAAMLGGVRESTAQAIVAAARDQKVALRVMGRAAIFLRCPSATRIAAPVEGQEDLLEMAGRGGQGGKLDGILASLGFEADRRFNTLFGSERLRYIHPGSKIFLEIFLANLVSYHRLELGSRLHLDETTVPLADLLLSLLQNVKATDEHMRPIAALLLDHDLGGPGQVEAIDTTRIAEMCLDDWGWYKTVTMNLEKCTSAASGFLEGDELETVTKRARRLAQIMEEAPKSLGWQVRARIGEGRRWYEEPE
jgi:predicted regulator of Ras-like GTPase activity (Roadblock/LC7/MglB family)